MPMHNALLPEFDMETANTRKCLERIPEDQLEWRAHEKSWTLRELATHLANLPNWTVMTIDGASFDMAPEGEEPIQEEAVTSVAHALKMFDANVAAARASIAGADDASLMTPWSLLKGGEVIFSMPRISVLRSFILNHLIHHRGQLTVYLRLIEVPVPAIYGPSADEAG